MYKLIAIRRTLLNHNDLGLVTAHRRTTLPHQSHARECTEATRSLPGKKNPKSHARATRKLHRGTPVHALNRWQPTVCIAFCLINPMHGSAPRRQHVCKGKISEFPHPSNPQVALKHARPCTESSAAPREPVCGEGVSPHHPGAFQSFSMAAPRHWGAWHPFQVLA